MIQFRKLENTITGSINGKPFNIIRTEENIKFLEKAKKDNIPEADILQFIEASRAGEIAMSNKYLVFNPITKEYFLTYDGYRSKIAIPQVLVDIIEESYNKDIDFMPVIKAWARLLNNPRYTTTMAEHFATYLGATFVDQKEVDRLVSEDIEENIAINMATYQDISISKEGLLVTYKVADIVDWKYLMEADEDGNYKKVMKNKYEKIAAVIDETTGDIITPESYVKPDFLEEYLFTPSICKSGDKFYSGDKIGYVYEIGKTQSLPKTAKRNLNHTFGGGGLYTGGLTYIDSYGNDNTKTLVCFVNPGDIISFQCEGRAFRTDAIFPNNVWGLDVPLKGTYHSSDYDKLSEERLADILRDAVEDGINLKEAQATYVGDDASE